MPKQFEYQKSEFKKKSIERIKVQTLNEEEFFNMIGSDTVTADMRQTVDATAREILAQRYGNPISIVQSRDSDIAMNHFYSEKDMEEDINQTHKQLFRGKSVGLMTKGKRAKSAMDKVEIQKHLLEEQQILIQNRTRDFRIAQSSVKKKEVKEYDENRYNNEDLKGIREFLLYTNQYGKDVVDAGMFGSETDAVNTYRIHLRAINEIDPKDFLYHSDAEFVSRFAEKYDKLCKAAAGEVLFQKYLELCMTDKNNLPLAQIKGKIAIFKELKEDYEDRIKLLSSPYYVLLSKGDLSEIPAEGGNAKLAEFKALAAKLSRSRVGKGTNPEKYFNRIMDQCAGEQAEHDKKIVKDLMGDAQLSDARTKDDAVLRFYEQKKKEKQETYTEKDADFLLNVQPELAGSLIEGMKEEDMKIVDETFASLLLENKLEEQEINQEHLEQIREKIKSYIDIRKELLAACVASKAATGVVMGVAIDMKNPAFVGTPEYKQIMAVYEGEMGYLSVQAQIAHLKKKTFSSMVDVYLLISQFGYSISDKYESRLQEGEAQAIEEGRVRYQSTYYDTLHPEEKKKYEEQKKKLPRIELPTFQMDGISYTIYIDDLEDWILSLSGKKIVIKETEREEADDLMKRFMEVYRKYFVLKSMFLDGGGTKAIVKMVYIEKLMEEKKKVEGRLLEILLGNVEGFREVYERSLIRIANYHNTYDSI